MVPADFQPVCHELLDLLLGTTFQSDEDALKAVSDFVQPLPLLMDTVRAAIGRSTDPEQQEFLSNVVLCVDDGCIFEAHHRLSAYRARQPFKPALTAFPQKMDKQPSWVLCNSAPSDVWMAACGVGAALHHCSLDSLSREDIVSAPALFLVVDEAPLRAEPFWQIPSATHALV